MILAGETRLLPLFQHPRPCTIYAVLRKERLDAPNTVDLFVSRRFSIKIAIDIGINLNRHYD
jgi:hypothetical protein